MNHRRALASVAVLSAFADGAIFGRRHGAAAPRVLALHGWGRTHRDWDRVLVGFDALAVDLPGFGASPPPPGPWGLADYAAAVAPVLGEHEEPWIVVGHSFGGSVAVHLATRPESAGRVGGLVLTGSPLIRHRSQSSAPPLAFRVARWLNRRGLYPDARMEAMREKRGSADYRAAAGVMRDTFVRVVNEDVAGLLGSVSQPVRLVWGSDDTAAPVETAREAAASLPSAHLQVLDGVGHDTLAEAPEALRSALGEALGDQTRRP